ncbi:hypothetical protein DL93DRAFT_2154173 [Clavulina sp. PMI_390]|nr:hypothetical protein DL93DRAFT_2154173 [Clavulina sp. PMI_390]
MSTRRASTIQEIQKRQRLQPVQTWRQEWVKPTNALPGSTYKVLKWVKGEQKQHFSDDEDTVAESTSVAVVVDEELEDSRMASELPDPEVNVEEGDGDEGDGDGDGTQPVSRADTTDPQTVAALQALDALDPADEAAQAAEDADIGLTPSLGDIGTSTPVMDADPDVLPMGDELLMPTPADQLLPEPAPDGPDLDEITQEQLLADAAAFSGTDGLIPVDADGVIPDEAMEFAIGEA